MIEKDLFIKETNCLRMDLLLFLKRHQLFKLPNKDMELFLHDTVWAKFEAFKVKVLKKENKP